MRQKNTKFFIGLVIVVSGISLLLKASNIDFSPWITSWWVYIILGLGIYNIIKNGVSIYNIAMTAFALSYIGKNMGWFPSFFKGSYIFGAAVIVFGFALIVKRDEDNKDTTHTILAEDRNNNSYSSIFSNKDIIIDEKIEDGTNLFALFSDINYEAQKAACENESIIDITSIFSDVELYLPENVKIIVKANPILGDIKNRRERFPSPQKAPSITLRILCLLGEVKIH